MDHERFATIARTLAADRSRRGVLRLLTGGALASAGLVRVATETEAKSGQACCAQKRKGCNQLCHRSHRRLDNADFTCNPDTCTPQSVILCNCV
jgi:hypothetical protein